MPCENSSTVSTFIYFPCFRGPCRAPNEWSVDNYSRFILSVSRVAKYKQTLTIKVDEFLSMWHSSAVGDDPQRKAERSSRTHGSTSHLLMAPRPS